MINSPDSKRHAKKMNQDSFNMLEERVQHLISELKAENKKTNKEIDAMENKPSTINKIFAKLQKPKINPINQEEETNKHQKVRDLNKKSIVIDGVIDDLKKYKETIHKLSKQKRPTQHDFELIEKTIDNIENYENIIHRYLNNKASINELENVRMYHFTQDIDILSQYDKKLEVKKVGNWFHGQHHIKSNESNNKFTSEEDRRKSSAAEQGSVNSRFGKF